MTTPDLDARYGRSPSGARRTRLVAVLAAVAFAVVFGAWLWWGGLLEPPAQIETKDTAHEILGDDAVSVTWQLSIEPGASAACAVQALNETFAVVGWLVVDIPPATTRTREFTQEIRTSELATTGLIYRCWLT